MWQKIKCWLGFHRLIWVAEEYKESGVWKRSKPYLSCKYCGKVKK